MPFDRTLHLNLNPSRQVSPFLSEIRTKLLAEVVQPLSKPSQAGWGAVFFPVIRLGLTL